MNRDELILSLAEGKETIIGPEERDIILAAFQAEERLHKMIDDMLGEYTETQGLEKFRKSLLTVAANSTESDWVS